VGYVFILFLTFCVVWLVYVFFQKKEEAGIYFEEFYAAPTKIMGHIASRVGSIILEKGVAGKFENLELCLSPQMSGFSSFFHYMMIGGAAAGIILA